MRSPRADEIRLVIREAVAIEFIETWKAANAVSGRPLEQIDALRDVQFVLKNGMVFKRGGVLVPAAFFHGGPVNGYKAR